MRGIQRETFLHFLVPACPELETLRAHLGVAFPVLLYLLQGCMFHMCVFPSLYTHKWRPVVDAECLPRSLATVFSETESLTEFGAHQMARLVGRGVRGIYLSSPPSCHADFLLGFWGSNSGPRFCTVGNLPTQSFPKPSTS